MDEKKKSRNRREIISDCLLTGGGIAVSLGIGLLHTAAGIIAAGVLAIAYGLLVGLGGDER